MNKVHFLSVYWHAVFWINAGLIPLGLFVVSTGDYPRKRTRGDDAFRVFSAAVAVALAAWILWG